MLVLALSLVLGGLLADYIGGAKTTIIGTACVTVSQFLYAVAPDWIVLFYIYILNQISHFYQPALTAIVMDSIPRGREFKGSVSFNILGSSISATLTRILPVEVRGRAVSIQRILDNIGASIASFVAGVFYVTVGSGLVFHSYWYCCSYKHTILIHAS